MTDKNPNELPFEEAMSQLEAIVNAMESGQLPLDQAMNKFQEATKLAAYCENKLGDFEKKLEILTKSEDGSAQWQNFNP